MNKKRLPRFIQRARETRSVYFNQTPYVPSLNTASGETVTPQTALTFTAVFSAINVIATDTASLPINVMQRVDGIDVPAPEKPQQRLLHVSPNSDMNAFRYRQATMGHVLGWGRGVSRIHRDGFGSPIALELLAPQTTRPKRNKTGQLYYEVEDGRKPALLPEDVLHIAGLGFDGIDGYSPIVMAREAVGLGKGAEVFGASFFGNGAMAGGYLKTPKKLSDTAAKNLRRTFNNRHQGARHAHQLGILEEGLEYVSNQISPEASQFLQTRQFQVLEIARMFRLPPHKIGDYSQAHLANLEESNLDYLQTTLLGWIIAIEAEYNLKLFSQAERDAGYHIRHDFTNLMRANAIARGQYWQLMKNAGVACSDTIAAREGLPLPGTANGGQIYTIQSQYIPAQLSGKVKPILPVSPPDEPDAVADPTVPSRKPLP